MPTSYHPHVTSIERCGEEIVIVRFDRPDAFEFRAGQWTRVTLQTPDGPEVRTLSLASAPQDDFLEITTRLSPSPFKQALAQLSVGDEVDISAPGGRLKLPEHAEKIAFLLGGVGVVPARSLLRSAVADGRAFEDAVIFYGNRDDTCEPFLAELEAMSTSGVRVVRVLERPPSGWTGEHGFITSELVSRHADTDRPFFVAGPPIMVTVMSNVLDELHVPGERRIIETFTPAGPHHPTPTVAK